MKPILNLLFILQAVFSFAQEKGIPCTSRVSFRYNKTAVASDGLCFDGFKLNTIYVTGGNFNLVNSDSIIYEVSLSEGDSLEYVGEWFTCQSWFAPSISLIDSVTTVKEGLNFPIVTYQTTNSYFNEGKKSKGVIRDSCLIQIYAVYTTSSEKSFLRVKFEKSKSENPIITDNPISITQKGEHALFIEGNIDKPMNLELFGLSGQRIAYFSVADKDEVDISFLSSGYFIATLTDPTGESRRLKFFR